MTHHQTSSQTSALTLRAKVSNFVKHNLALAISEVQLVQLGLDNLSGIAPVDQLKAELVKTVAYQTGRHLEAYIDIDECTSHLLHLNVKGCPYSISLKTLLGLIEMHGAQSGRTQ